MSDETTLSETAEVTPAPLQLPSNLPASVRSAIETQAKRSASIASEAAPDAPVVAANVVATSVAPVTSVTVATPATASVTVSAGSKIGSFFSDLGKDVATSVDDAVKGIEYVITIGDRVIQVIEEAKALSPDFKAELSTLVNDAKALATTVAPAIAAEGTNVTVDVATLVAAVPEIVTLVKDLLAFIPTIEAGIKAIDNTSTSAAS